MPSAKGILAHPAVRRVLALDPKDGRKTEQVETDEAPPKQKNGAGSGADAAPHLPWELVDEPRHQQLARRAGRALLWATVGLLVLLGLRSVIAPPRAVHEVRQVTKSSPAEEFPQTEAQAVATRFARSYLTLPGGPGKQPQQVRSQRAAEMRQDTAVDLSSTWDGTGTQSVLTLLPGDVRATSATAATVDVLAEVDNVKQKTTPAPKPKPGQKPVKATTTQQHHRGWLTLSVPVQEVGGRVVVSASPLFRSTPAAQAPSEQSRITEDTAASDATRANVDAFLRAWAGNDAAQLRAVTAPGARLSPLGQQLTYSQLSRWAVEKAPGSQNTRTGHAQVVWKTASGASITQRYTLQLQKVAAGGTTDLRVATATADPTTTEEN